MHLKEDKLTEIVIDLDKLKENRLDESFLAMFGYHIKTILSLLRAAHEKCLLLPVQSEMKRNTSTQLENMAWKIQKLIRTNPS